MKLALNAKNLADLEKEKIAPAITIYLPLSKTLAKRKANRIRLENLLKDAARQVIRAGSDKSYARQLVEPGFELARNHFFWKTNASGLALFIVPPRILRYFELPLAVKESVCVAKGFDIVQLGRTLRGNRDFFILAASENKLSFYAGNFDLIKKLKLRGLKERVKDFLPGRDPEKTLQSHGRAPIGKREIFHGHGKGKDVHKNILLKYFQMANDKISRYLADKTEPLIFAGTDGVFSIYRQANTYPYLFNKNLRGNFEDTHPKIIQKKALELLQNAPQ